MKIDNRQPQFTETDEQRKERLKKSGALSNEQKLTHNEVIGKQFNDYLKKINALKARKNRELRSSIPKLLSTPSEYKDYDTNKYKNYDPDIDEHNYLMRDELFTQRLDTLADDNLDSKNKKSTDYKEQEYRKYRDFHRHVQTKKDYRSLFSNLTKKKYHEIAQKVEELNKIHNTDSIPFDEKNFE